MVTMLVLSRQFKAGSKLCVRAFSTTFTGRIASPSSFPASFNERVDKQNYHPRHLSYSTSSVTSLAAGAQVDEDLDTALDELLASPFDENTKPKIQKKKPVFDSDHDDDDDDEQTVAAHHMKDSKPVPSTLLAEVSTASSCLILLVAFCTVPHTYTHKHVNQTFSRSHLVYCLFDL
jgi:hypothetical protein